MVHRALRSPTLIPLAIVLPPREAFAPAASGALGLLARRHAQWRGGFAATVIGSPPPTQPFADVPFAPVRRHWRGYAAGVLDQVRDAALIEVHNRPDVALALARRRPRLPVTLILNNDPQDMRRAHSPAERRRLIEHLAGVAVSSAYLGERLMGGVPAPARPPTVLANCIDMREVPHSASSREPLIVFAGRVVADKGADAFVAACARALPELPGWRAEMLGGDRFGPHNPETPFLRALRPRAEAAGVLMRGYLPHAEVLDAMTRAAIVVVPSRWSEPFGLTALEAMACGAALLCSNRGGLAEVTGDAAVAIDPEEFATDLRDLARDHARRAALSAAGLARAARFDMPAIGPMLDTWRHETLARFHASDRAPI